jgi:hypothetical protein
VVQRAHRMGARELPPRTYREKDQRDNGWLSPHGGYSSKCVKDLHQRNGTLSLGTVTGLVIAPGGGQAGHAGDERLRCGKKRESNKARLFFGSVRRPIWPPCNS